MSGYHEPSTPERVKAQIRSGAVSAARAVGEALLFAFIVAWSAFWLRVGWSNYVQGHVTELVAVTAFAVLPLAGWYTWRTLGYLPVERPAFDERVPTSAST